MSDEFDNGTEVVDAPKSKRGPRHQYSVTPEDFVRTWQTSESADEVATKLKMPKNIVLARSAVYRKNRPDGTPGVPLKRMSRKNSRKLDVVALTELVNSGSY